MAVLTVSREPRSAAQSLFLGENTGKDSLFRGPTRHNRRLRAGSLKVCPALATPPLRPEQGRNRERTKPPLATCRALVCPGRRPLSGDCSRALANLWRAANRPSGADRAPYRPRGRRGADPPLVTAARRLGRLLYRRTWHGPMRAEYAAVASAGLEYGATRRALVEEHARVHRHRLGPGVAAYRARQRAGQHDRATWVAQDGAPVGMITRAATTNAAIHTATRRFRRLVVSQDPSAAQTGIGR